MSFQAAYFPVLPTEMTDIRSNEAFVLIGEKDVTFHCLVYENACSKLGPLHWTSTHNRMNDQWALTVLTSFGILFCLLFESLPFVVFLSGTGTSSTQHEVFCTDCIPNCSSSLQWLLIHMVLTLHDVQIRFKYRCTTYMNFIGIFNWARNISNRCEQTLDQSSKLPLSRDVIKCITFCYAQAH